MESTKEFTSISRLKLQAAFGLAHRASEDLAIPTPIRKKFLAIATLIWEGHGEPGLPPKKAGEMLLDRGVMEACLRER